jgi:hypothetical protein
MRYAFTAPEGWLRTPFPPPQKGIYLRAPIAKPGPESASILLLDAVVPDGSIEDHLGAFVKGASDGVKVLKQGKPARFQAVTLSGMCVSVQVQVNPPGGKPREESRAFAMVDAGHLRLPISFVGAAKALSAHQKIWDALLASIRPLQADFDPKSSPYSAWIE